MVLRDTDGVRRGTAGLAARPLSAWLPLLVSIVAAAAFVAVRPGVPDLEAALARASAAAHGVGLTYWFQWFSGASAPGQYSIITPWLSAQLSAPLLGALGTVAVTPLLHRALRDTPHALAGTWAGTITAGASLWSGRIAFAVGAVCAVLALVGVRERRPVRAAIGTLASALSSPVTAAFLVCALVGTAAVDRDRRRLALALLAGDVAVLLTLLAVFGEPGPAIFRPLSALGVAVSTLLMLLARPSRVVTVVAGLTALACPFVLLIPNGLGSNLERMSFICLPAAVLATARVRRTHALLFVTPAIALCVAAAVHDVGVATRAPAADGYYEELTDRLDVLPDLHEYRLEVVQSRSFHTASYVLLDHAALATGWETQTERALDSVLGSPHLDAAQYRAWLDDNAVGYVAFDHRIPDRASPEYRLVAHGLPFLTRVWQDGTWTLYRIAHPQPIVAAPSRLVAATQAQLRISVPCACRVPIRVHWSSYLEMDGASHGVQARLAPDGHGWTVADVPRPGTYVLGGS